MKRELSYIGERINAVRVAKGITMEELGVHAKVSGQHIGLLERGKSGISILTLIRIAKALEVSTDSLLIEDEEPKNIPSSTKDTIKFLLDGFTEEELNFFVRFIRLYREEHPLKNQD